MTQAGVVAGSRVLADWISLGVLASSVPRDVVDDAVEAAERARGGRGKLPPHVMVYLVMALALFADDDYEEVAARLAETLRGWGGWERDWEVPTSGGITQARQRLGPEPVAEVFGQVAVPVADLDTAGAFLGGWRLMSVDGMEWDVPDTAANRAAFGSRAGPAGPGAVPEDQGGDRQRVRLACGGGGRGGPGGGREGQRGAGAGPPAYPGLEEDRPPLADRNFYSFADWCAAAGTGRRRRGGSGPTRRCRCWRCCRTGPGCRCWSARCSTAVGDRLGTCWPRPAGASTCPGTGPGYVRAWSTRSGDRDGNGQDERVILITSITDPRLAPAGEPARAYHQR